MSPSPVSPYLSVTVLAIAALALAAGVLADENGPFLDRFDTVNLVASTVPENGDQNPYGIVVVPRSVGLLKRGHILISNFNNGVANLQGLGTTIVQVSPEGTLTLFAQIAPSMVAGRLPDRAQQRRPCGGNLPRRRYQRALGHDRLGPRGARLALCHQRAQRRRNGGSSSRGRSRHGAAHSTGGPGTRR